MKKILVTILFILISSAGCSKKTNDEPSSSNSDAVGKAVFNAAIQISNIDISTALSGSIERFKSVCATNKYGLSEETCIQTIDARNDICIQQTAQKYPGKLTNFDGMQETLSSHVDCLFQK